MVDLNEFNIQTPIQWCPGCPNHLILHALREALTELEKYPHEICLVSGIGQAAKLPHYMRCNFFNGLHGRALPVATAISVAKPDLTVVVTTGDGDCYGEGGNHFIHTIRRNPNVTLLVHNNAIYGLTKGQASPTTPIGERRSLHVVGVSQPPLNPLAIAIIHQAPFVARAFALERSQLKEILKEAIMTRGFSYVDIIQPCITWDSRPLDWFRQNVKMLDSNYDPGDFNRALEVVLKPDPPFLTGVIFKGPHRSIFGEDFFRETGYSSLSELAPPSSDEISKILDGFKPTLCQNNRE
ncbi:MAG: thiamine pyrophosphate-dependent enzyme [Syntrophobacterales bacterium]|nr:thiamine pyrophosphate-dependent enzyme [Syntrophobacterales bacterium]